MASEPGKWSLTQIKRSLNHPNEGFVTFLTFLELIIVKN